MQKWLVMLLLPALSVRAQNNAAIHPTTDGWKIFSQVKFTSKYFPKYKEYFLFPEFDARIRFMEGKEIVLQGYYLPYALADESAIIISRYPFSSCFFCGGAGPESVAQVVFNSKPPKFKADQVITVRGTLWLNETDVNQLNFILLNAVIVDRPGP